MDRSEILALVIKNLKRTVTELRAEEIDPTMSMVQMGATSLDIVEVVSTSMRALKVKVPRAALGELKCLDDLVTLLHRIHRETYGGQAEQAQRAGS